MMRRAIAMAILVVGLLAIESGQASTLTIETDQLIVSDATGNLSNDQLKVLADKVQAMLAGVLKFWSADAGVDRFGKIQVVFDFPQRACVYTSVFYWETKNNERRRIVRVFGTERPPQLMAHKLTSAVFPQKDKLIRNAMGILSEAQIGNPLSFPRCGFDSDDWVLALVNTKSIIPLDELGPDHESWGMRDAGGGNLLVLDRAKQHKAYAEAGSFCNYLFRTYGIERIKQLHRRSFEKARPTHDVFGKTIQELDVSWQTSIRADEKGSAANASTLSKLIRRNPRTACSEAQQLAISKP